MRKVQLKLNRRPVSKIIAVTRAHGKAANPHRLAAGLKTPNPSTPQKPELLLDALFG